MNKQDEIRSVMKLAPVIPVVVADSASDAVNLSRALVAGGLPAIEITLRTSAAIDAIKAVSEDVDGAVVGAGTVVTPADVAAVEKAGAKFMVSPGVSPVLLDACEDSAVPLLPGAATSSEMMALGERGILHLKFFPGMQAGGPGYLKSVSGPLPQFSFCPTGGVTVDNAGEFLKLSNVLCVGGSWVAPKEMVQSGDWDGITRLAKAASLLGS